MKSKRNLFIIGLLLTTKLALAALDPAADRAVEARLAAVVPSDRQYAWQRRHEVYAFVHFGPNTFTGREWGTGTELPEVFNPTELDARQWVRALQSAGMSMAILTAKHHDGFCLWPSRYTGQSVAGSPWRQGRGDLVREFVEAARAGGLRVGLYLSPADLYQIENAAGYYGNGRPAMDSVIPTDPGSFQSDPARPRAIAAGAPGAGVVYPCRVDDYNRYYLNQLFELLTEYGPIDEVWLDGATPKRKGGQQYAYADWYALIRRLQPQAVIFGKGPDVRWVGNEKGVARETEWSVIGLDRPEAGYDWPDLTAAVLGDREQLAGAVALHWYPAEADVSIRPGWFYHAAETPKSGERLLELYEQSVGRNATFLLNVPPDQRGLFSAADIASLEAFGQLRTARYGTNLAGGAAVAASSVLPGHPAAGAVDADGETYWEADARGEARTPVTFELTLPQPVTFTCIQLQEEIRRGQRVEAFVVEARLAGEEWREIASATTIGYKRILPVPATTADRVRVRFDRYRVAPTLAGFSLHH